MTVEPVSQADRESPPSFGDLFRQLISDVLAYLDAERKVYSVQARLSGKAASAMGGYALAAVVLAQGAMVALVVGLLLVLSPLIGAAWATAGIVVGCTILAIIFISLIRRKMRAVRANWTRRNDG